MIDHTGRDPWDIPPSPRGPAKTDTRGQNAAGWITVSVLGAAAVLVIGFFAYAAWTEYPMWWVRGGLVLAAAGVAYYAACRELHRRAGHRSESARAWCIGCLQEY